MADAARAAEALGFDSAWFPDSQLLWRDAFVTMAVAALRTERITLGTAVTNVATRHPSVLASAARTVQELAPGRVILGVGTGNSAVHPVGLRASTRREMAAGVEVVRALQRGDAWTFGATKSGLRDPVGTCPVYIAATGPKNLAFAGQHGDGVMLLGGIAPTAIERSLTHVARGIEAGGRDVADVEVVVATFCQVTDDIERDARLLKPICAALAQGGAQEHLAIAGIDLPDPGPIAGVYPDLIHAEDWPQAVEAAGRYVSDDDAIRFARSFCLFGTPDEIAARIDAAAAVGVTSFYLQHVGSYDLPHTLMEQFANTVLPRYAQSVGE